MQVRWQPWPLRILLTMAFGIIASCQANPVLETSRANVVTPLRFPHEVHTARPCEFCHQADVSGQPTPSRPGQSSHASCAEAGCHGSEFSGEPTPLCGLCHDSLQTEDGPRATLVPYPPVAGPRAQAVAFSHAGHLDAARMEEKLGFHISCTDCHALPSRAEMQSDAPGSDLPRPSHEACARCHAAEAALPGSPTMAACDGCHQPKEERRRERQFIAGDLHFRHSSHHSDRRGRRIGCVTCHASTAQTDGQDRQTQSQDMQVCVSCHNDENRVPSNRRMSRCETCHATRSASIRAIAPRSHMPATERPANHTQAFRQDHEADADRPTANCARCHTMMSGNRRNTCDECHQVMEPRDHVVTWREYDHGPQAVTQPDRCTTCHQVDFCVACHSARPRSHFPSLDFRRGGHGTLAILNLRACVTCHQVASDCSGSGCHRGDGF